MASSLVVGGGRFTATVCELVEILKAPTAIVNILVKRIYSDEWIEYSTHQNTHRQKIAGSIFGTVVGKSINLGTSDECMRQEQPETVERTSREIIHIKIFPTKGCLTKAPRSCLQKG
eukprot:6486905-Amphidinium_carterae.1